MRNSSTPITPSPRHPPGLYTLFFTEMWERCSYYGMRGLLVLFMKATLAEGGLEFSIPMAGAIYGLYTAAVYLAAMPGGWVADRLLGAGAQPEVSSVSRNDWRLLGGALAALGLLVALIWGGVIPVNHLQVANAAKWIIVALAVFAFLRLFLLSDLTGVEKKRIGVVAVLFVAAVTFFAGLELAGSSLNLFADQYTNRMLGLYEMPASWFQAINPLFVVLLGPVAAGVWVALSAAGAAVLLMFFAKAMRHWMVGIK